MTVTARVHAALAATLLGVLLLVSPAQAGAPAMDAGIVEADVDGDLELGTAEAIAMMDPDETVVIGSREVERVDPRAVAR